MVKAIPDGYHTITPYLVVNDASKLITFLKAAFDAVETAPPCEIDGKILHAELKIGNSMLMLGQACETSAANTSMLHLYVNDTDHYYQKALAAGASSIMEPIDQFYGDRSGAVKDMFGNSWWLATHIEDLSPEEVNRRAAVYKKQQT